MNRNTATIAMVKGLFAHSQPQRLGVLLRFENDQKSRPDGLCCGVAVEGAGGRE